MTRDTTDRGVNSETSSIPKELDQDPAVNDPTEANLSWSDEILVKSEIIISSDDTLPTSQCRLCHCADHLCLPLFNLRGGTELSEAHLETIYRLSDIAITYEKDHASVVCSYCLLKIEEYTAIREVWQMNNNIPKAHESKVLAKPADLHDASTQTTDYQIAKNVTTSTEVRATSCEKASEADRSTVEHSAINVAGRNNEQTQCEVIDVDEYICSKVNLKRRRSKTDLIEEVMHLVKKQYRTKPHTKNRPSR
ncbi:uncharacterized protein LOC126564796 [Anopheles maculipalpis]|uniref:uncharacterized protein LOC126564796 n=1 Tax=Anopheles maculipalpis TaxID=1496333 RepID=UPI002159A289|nr:uncharacterized protein LOC126564796 [Anopheles maculipalpis]